MNVQEAILKAENLLHGQPEPEGNEDPRWQAIIEISDFIESNPKEILEFVLKWGGHENEDIRNAVASCLLEHLLEYHFELVFPQIKDAARRSSLFGDMVSRCFRFGQSEEVENSKKLDELIQTISRSR